MPFNLMNYLGEPPTMSDSRYAELRLALGIPESLDHEEALASAHRMRHATEAPRDPSPEFERWWKEYPRSDSKRMAFRAWHARGLDKQIEPVLARLVAHKQEWQDRSTKYWPMPTTYLHQERYLDPMPKERTPLTEEEILKIASR